jgi:hypothetical protein
MPDTGWKQDGKIRFLQSMNGIPRFQVDDDV